MKFEALRGEWARRALSNRPRPPKSKATLLAAHCSKVFFDPPYSAPEYWHSWKRSLAETLRGGPDDVILSGSQLFDSTKVDLNGIGKTLALMIDGGHSVTLVYPGIAFKEIVRQSSRVRAMVPTDLQPSIVFFGD